MLYWVNLKYACGGIETSDDIIVKTPPIWKGWKNKNIKYFIDYYQNKGTLIEIKEI